MAGRVFTFGKYKGERVDIVIEKDPDYVIWADRNIDFFSISGEEFVRLSGALYERAQRSARQPDPEDEQLPDFGCATIEDLEAYDRSFDEL